MTAMADRIEIVSAERVRDELVKLVLSPRTHGPGSAARATPVWRSTSCRSCPRCASRCDEHHRHKDVYEHTLTVLDQAIALEDGRRRRPDLVQPTRCTAARHRQAADPSVRDRTAR